MLLKNNKYTIGLEYTLIFLSYGKAKIKLRIAIFIVNTDRNRTVLQRSELRSRTALMGEQPNPWNLVQLQDAMIQHRGAERARR